MHLSAHWRAAGRFLRRVAGGIVSTARVLTYPAPAPAADQSRILAIDGTAQSRFVRSPASFFPTQQAWLRAGAVRVHIRPGLAEFQRSVVLRNNLLEWKPDHRLTPGFVDFVDGQLVYAEASRPETRLSHPLFVLCHAFHRNYGHWLLDCLPCLMPWRTALAQGRLKLLVPPLAKWQTRTIALLGIPETALIETKQQSVLCDDAIVPGLKRSETSAQTISHSNTLYQPRAAVVETVRILQSGIRATAKGGQPERIYVSRRGVESYRILQNEDEVELAMTRLGFVVVRPQELSFDNQVAMFARARVIAGPHGAGLTNAVFAPPGCLIVDFSLDTWATTWMVRVARLFDHCYLPLEFPTQSDKSRPVLLGNVKIANSHVYTVPVSDLVSAIETAIQRLALP